MPTTYLPSSYACGYGIHHRRHDSPQTLLLALVATVTIHGAILKLGLAVFSSVTIPAQVASPPLLVSLAPLLGEAGPAGQRNRYAGSGHGDTPGSRAAQELVPAVAPLPRTISAPLPPAVALWPADNAATRVQDRLGVPAILLGISRGKLGAGYAGSLSGLALSAALDGRMQEVMERQGNYISPVSDEVEEDIVSRRARCLVVPFVFSGPAREADSTITMPDPFCEPEPLPFALDRSR